MEKTIIAEPVKMKRKIFRPRSESRKRLRFSSYSELVEIEQKSSSEAQNMWYTKKETAQFKRDVLFTSQALRETRTAKVMKHMARSAAFGLPPDDIHVKGKEVIHGIEHLISPEVLKLLLVQRRRTIAAVISDHQAQKIAGRGVDALRTAQVSEACSSFSKELCSRMTHFQYS